VRAQCSAQDHAFFVTDDNFARNKNWEAILDRLIALRAEGVKIPCATGRYAVPTARRASSRKAPRPGCNTVFIGLENINPQSLSGAKKRQNKIWEYREMLQAWKASTS